MESFLRQMTAAASCSNEANLTADSPSPELVKQGKSASGLSEGKTERPEFCHHADMCDLPLPTTAGVVA